MAATSQRARRLQTSRTALFFAKTGAAQSAVTVAMFPRNSSPDDREGGFAGAPGRAFARTYEFAVECGSVTSPFATACTRRGVGASFASERWGSRGVIVGEVAGQHAPQVSLVEDDHIVDNSRRMDPITRSN